MNNFVQLSSKTFFTDFYTNFIEHNDSLDSTLIVCHSSKGFGIESKNESWIWRFFRWMTTTTYDLESHAFTILQLAESLDSRSASAAELASASKVCSALKSVFMHPYNKDESKIWEEYITGYERISHNLLIEAAAKQKISPLLLACREGRFSEALYFVKKNGVALDAHSFIDQLVEHSDKEKVTLKLIQAGATHSKITTEKAHWLRIAMQHKAYDVVDKMIALEALAEMDNAQARQLLSQAIAQEQSKLALMIISKGVDVLGEIDNTQGSFLHLACQNELVDVVKALLEKGVSLFHTNKNKQTALHVASEVLHGELVMLLMSKGADLSLRDAKGILPLNAPYELFEDDSVEVGEFYQVIFLEFPAVQQFLQVHDRTGLEAYLLGNIEDLLEEMGPKLFFELAVMLQYEPLAKALVTHISKDEFVQIVAELSKKYTRHTMAMIEYAPYIKNSAHYNLGVQNIVVDKPEGMIQLRKYLHLFDALNTTDETSDDFFDLEQLRSDNGKDISREVLRKNFVIMLNRIIFRERYDGKMPAQGADSFNLFYETIENALENVRIKLAQMKRACDPRFAKEVKSEELQLRRTDYIKTMHFVFRELLGAMKHCPGRYYNTSIKVYLKVCKNVVLSFPDEVYRGLGEFRQILIEGWLGEAQRTNQAHNVNNDNYVLRYYGKKYGLPGSSIMAAYADPYGGVPLEQVDKMIDERYTPAALIDGWLFPLIAQSDHFAAWCKTIVPKDWQKEKYEPIYKRLKELERTYTARSEIISFLQGHDIVHNPKLSYEESVREDCDHSYISTQLYDENTGKLKHVALCDILVRLQIVSSCFEEDKLLVPSDISLGSFVSAIKRFVGI
jgi:hypothetical protein